MKKIFLSLFLILSNYLSFAYESFGDPNTKGCIEFNASTGKMTLNVTYSTTDWVHFVYPSTTPAVTTWAYIKKPSAPGYFGPYVITTIDPATLSAVYDITPLLSQIQTSECHDFFIVSDVTLTPSIRGTIAPPFNLTPLDPVHDPTSPRYIAACHCYWNPSQALVMWNACPCPTSDPLPPCNSGFGFKLTQDTKSSPFTAATRIGEATIDVAHWGSLYFYDWGDHTYSTTPISKLYAAGSYKVCVTETTIAGIECTDCINFCVSDDPAIKTTIPASPLAPWEQPEICDLDFKFELNYHTDPGFTASDIIGKMLLSKYHYGSTYTYDWGDSYITTYPEDHVYLPGTYNVCITETKPLTPGRNTPTICKTCMTICVGPGLPPIAFRKSNDNTITGSGMMENKISISPNPTSSNATINLELAQKDNVHVMVIDMTGKKVSEIFNGSLAEGAQKLNINTDNFASGLYQVQVLIGNKMSTHKLSVVK